jgi:hypothetical protein
VGPSALDDQEPLPSSRPARRPLVVISQSARWTARRTRGAGGGGRRRRAPSWPR